MDPGRMMCGARGGGVNDDEAAFVDHVDASRLSFDGGGRGRGWDGFPRTGAPAEGRHAGTGTPRLRRWWTMVVEVEESVKHP